MTFDEMNKFIGLCLLSETIHFPRLAMQWSTNPLYFHPLFGKCISRNRFTEILKMLRFVNHDNIDRHDPLHKIRPILEKVIENIKKVVNPVKELSIDESDPLARPPSV